MADSRRSNLPITLKQTIPTTYGTSDTFYIFETGADIVVDNASVVWQNKNQLERMVLNINSAGLCTIVLRGLDNTNTKTEDSNLNKEWSVGSEGYITVLASDIVDLDGDNAFTGDNTFAGTSTFNNDVSIDGNLDVTNGEIDFQTATLGFRPPSLTQTEINALSTVGTGFVYNTTTGKYQTLIATVWVDVDTSTFPNISPSLVDSGTIAGSFSTTTVSTVTHNLGITQADLEQGRYMIKFSFNLTGTGINQGMYRETISSSNIETAAQKRDAADPTANYLHTRQTNTMKVYFTPQTMATSGVVTSLRYYIFQVY